MTSVSRLKSFECIYTCTTKKHFHTVSSLKVFQSHKLMEICFAAITSAVFSVSYKTHTHTLLKWLQHLNSAELYRLETFDLQAGSCLYYLIQYTVYIVHTYIEDDLLSFHFFKQSIYKETQERKTCIAWL